MSKSVFYHAGCPVCLTAEQEIIELIGSENVAIVHLGEEKGSIDHFEKSKRSVVLYVDEVSPF